MRVRSRHASMTRYESYCRRGWLARKFLASVSLHKPSWIAFPLPGVTPWPPPRTKARVDTSDDNEDRKATRDSGRAFSSLPTEIYIHCICFSTFSPRLSPFMLFSVRIFPFLLTHGEPEVRTLYLNC